MVKLADYLNDKMIAFLETSTRDETIKALVHLCHINGKIADEETFYQKIQEREQIVSTGIGMSVAIPHAKLAGFDQFFIAVGHLKKGVEWNSIDGQPVRLIFMIGGPDDKQTEYLRILSTLTALIKDEELRKKMLTANSPKAMISLLK